MDIKEALHWRYAVKRFDPARKIAPADWEVLRSSLVLSPSSYGLQPWKFIVVQDPGVRKTLRAASLNQSQVEDCSHFVVLTSRVAVDEAYIDEFVSEMANTRRVTPESLGGYRRMVIDDLVKGPRSALIGEWAARQAYIALGTLITTGAVLGVDACPMEGIEPARYDEILGLAGSSYRTVVACALGFRSADDKYASAAKVRFPESRLVEVF